MISGKQQRPRSGHRITYKAGAGTATAACTCGWKSRAYTFGPLVVLAAREHRQLEAIDHAEITG